MQNLWIKQKRIDEDQMEILNIFKFIQKGPVGTKRNQIQEKEFVAKVREIAPNIIAICICYSHLSQVHLMLEKAGILAKERLERDFQMVTKGRSITLDPTQSKLLYRIAEPENITKTTIIHGPEGSGKSLLALEVVKMKLSHYLMEHDLTGMKIRKQTKVRVLLCGTYQGEDRVPHLLRQLLSDSKDISDRCDLQVQPIKDLKMSTPKEFCKSLKKILADTSQTYSMTIVMMDELFPGFTTDKWKDLQGIDGVDFVLALRHAFNDGLCLGWHRKIWKKEKVYQDVMDQQGVHQVQGTIFCHLRMSFRCTEDVNISTDKYGNCRIPTVEACNDDAYSNDSRNDQWNHKNGMDQTVKNAMIRNHRFPINIELKFHNHCSTSDD